MTQQRVSPITVTSQLPATPMLTLTAATGQSADLTQWRDSTGSIISRINSGGGVDTTVQLTARSAVTAGTPNYLSASLNVVPLNAGIVGAVIRGFASQTANLQEWQNSAGTNQASISASGKVTGVDAGFSGSVSFGVVNNPVVSVAFIQPRNATTDLGLIIRQNGSSTQDLTQWQNSAGTVLARIDSAGKIGVGTAPSYPLHVITTANNGAAWFAETDNNTSPVANAPVFTLQNLSNTTNAYVGINLVDAAGSVVSAIHSQITDQTNHYGTFEFWTRGTDAYAKRLTISSTGNVLVNGFSASTIGLVVKGAASQSANLQEWQASDGTNVATMSVSGFLRVARLYGQSTNQFILDTGGGFRVIPAANTNIPLEVRGAASQSANLQEWQDSTGTVLARVTNLGNITANGAPDQLGIISSHINGTSLRFESTATNGRVWRVGGNFVNGNGEFSIYDATSARETLRITNAGQVFLNGFDAATTGLRIRGAASQTANLQEWQNSAGTAVAYITNLGDFQAPAIVAAYSLRTISGGAAVVPMTVKGAASQTANLQEWQDSSGGVLTRITSNGQLVVSNNTFSGNYYTNTSGFYVLNTGELRTVAQSATVVPMTAKGAASQTANLQEWQDSSGSARTRVEAAGHFRSQRISITNGTSWFDDASLNVSAYGTGVVGVIVRGAASQTANLQEWQNSSGNVLAGVSSGGAMFVARGSALASTALSVNTGTATNVGIAVQAAPSQTANLQEWQNSSGTVLGNITSAGDVSFGIRSGWPLLSTGAQASQGVVQANNFYSGSSPVFVVIAHTSQTSDLQQWQSSGNSVLLRVNSGGSIGLNTNSFGGGVNVLAIGNAGTVPNTNPSGGGVLYAESGALKWRDPSGNVAVMSGNAQFVSIDGGTA